MSFPEVLVTIPSTVLDDGDSGEMATVRSLSDVPEDGPFTPTESSSPTASSSTLNPPAPRSSGSRSGGTRRSASSRSMARSSQETLGAGTSRRTGSVSSIKDGRSKGTLRPIKARVLETPVLPHDPTVPVVPSGTMYWSRAPVYGTLPSRTMRGHTVTLVDNIAWIFGGCDSNETSREMYCFDTETMQWSHPETTGDKPKPSRAHTATLVDKRIIIYGGGQSTTYYPDVYIFDTESRRWSKPVVTGDSPNSRRAHSSVLYKGKIWVFGGGNGMMPLNDVWTLDVSKPTELKWQKEKTSGTPPTSRGYHSANLIGNVMIVIGGSDGKDCFSQIWTLNLDTSIWQPIDLKTGESFKLLSHSSTQVGSYLFIQGGHDGQEYTSDMHLFNLVNLQYERRPIFGIPPSRRGYHVSILHDSRLFFFGGFDGQRSYDEVYILDLASSAYLPQVTSFAIEIAEDD